MNEDKYIQINLPSNGLVYDISTIKIRPFVGKDETIIAELNVDNLQKKFFEVISNTVVGINPAKLTSGDAKYIMMWQAINSYTQEYPITLLCENCLKTLNIISDLGKINSVNLDSDYKQESIKILDKTYQLRLLTLADEVASYNFAKSYDSMHLYNFARSIIDDKLSTLDKVGILEKASPREINEIRKFHNKYTHGPDMIITYNCSSCEFEGTADLPFRLDTLLSFDR